MVTNRHMMKKILFAMKKIVSMNLMNHAVMNKMSLGVHAEA